jgi:hypothetical protein
MKTFNIISNTFCALALLAIATFATPTSLTAQILVPNQHIKIATIPSGVLQQLTIIDTRTVDLTGQTLAAPLNSSISGSFKVPADGTITLKLKFDHKGNLPINHTVRIELRDPNNVVVKKINEFIVKHNLITTATLTAVASKELSGCSGLNMWSYKVINNDNVNHQATLVDGTVTTADATGFRSVFPTGAYTLTQNQFGDYVFQTPIGHKGQLKIKVTYNNNSTVEARLFKPDVEPAPNEANATAIKNITDSGQILVKSVVSGDVSAANQFWTVRLRNKLPQSVSNAKVTVEFVDCSE